MATTKKSAPQRKPQGKCIFCNGHGMTKQHVWPDWMGRDPGLPTYRQVATGLAYSQQITHSTPISRYANGRGVHLKKAFYPPVIRKGHIGTWKVRMVCSNCNNGWMSQVEQRSKAVITALMLSQAVVLSQDDQAALASWAALMTVVLEFTHIPSKAIPHIERKYVMEHMGPPLTWVIFAGKSESQERAQYFHHSSVEMKSLGVNESMPVRLELGQLNLQATIVIVGGLLLYSISTTFSNAQAQLENYEHPKLVRIWPLTTAAINWAEMPAISHEEAIAFEKLHHSIIT